MLDLSYHIVDLHVQHPMSSVIIENGDCEIMIKTSPAATVAKSVLDSIVATNINTGDSTAGDIVAESASGVSASTGQYSNSSATENPSRVVGVSAGKLDRLLEKLASAARREFDHDRRPLKSSSSSSSSQELVSNDTETLLDCSPKRSADQSDSLECTATVTIEQDPTHRSIEPSAEEETNAERKASKDCHQAASFTSSSRRTDKQSASATTARTSEAASTVQNESKLNTSSTVNNMLSLAGQKIALDDAQNIQQLMLAVLNMSQKSGALSQSPASAGLTTTMVGGDVPDTDEDESDSLPDLKIKLGSIADMKANTAGTLKRRGSVHDSTSNEECSNKIFGVRSNSSAHSNTSATKSDDANHALALQQQRRRSIAHSTSANSHDRRHETTNSSHDLNGQEQHRPQRAVQQQAPVHRQQHNPPQHCESSTLTRPPQVATDDEQVVPKFSHCLPFDLNGRRNRAHNSNISQSNSITISPTKTTNSSNNTTVNAMRATTPNSTFMPATMDPSFLTSYLLSQAQFNQEQSALMSLAQQYQLLESLTRPAKRARLEVPAPVAVAEDSTTNDLAAKLLNQLIYAQRPIIAPNHHVDSPLDLSVKTPSPQPMSSPRSVSPIDSVLLARLHQQQQLIASHEAFKRRSSGSSTISDLTSSLPSTPTTPASLLSQHALHGTIFDPSLIFGDQTQLKIDTRIDSTKRQRKSHTTKVAQKHVSPSTSPRSELSSDSPSAVGECHACHLCGQTFAFYDRLAKHIASRHKVKTSPTQGLDASGRAYNCDICNRSFARSDMLTRHMRLHTGIKPYTCGVCQQVFSRSDHLSTHQRTHTGEKPYKCPQCPYAACRRDMITRHMKTHSRYEMPDSSSSAASPLAASPIH